MIINQELRKRKTDIEKAISKMTLELEEGVENERKKRKIIRELLEYQTAYKGLFGDFYKPYINSGREVPPREIH